LMKGSVALHSSVGFGSTFCMRIPLKFVMERAESVTESLQSQQNNVAMATMPDDIQAGTLGRSERSRSDTSVRSGQANGTAMTFDQASKPRLVGLSQPFFTTSPSPSKDPVTALELSNPSNTSATTGVEKIRVLVAEDNKVNQEVVLRMLKLEDIYGTSTILKHGHSNANSYFYRCYSS
jgi:osomolarity two-component system, sensor histidine kinase SLN1